MMADKRPKRWYVTASHRRLDRTLTVPVEVPYGTSHVRAVGATVTACGEPAFEWPIFWDTEYDEVEDICRECRWTAHVEMVQAKDCPSA